VVVMSYVIVGMTAFVHETSRYQAIGKLKGAIKEREEAHHQLQEATHAKSQFMANISHGTPLLLLLHLLMLIAIELAPHMCCVRAELRTPLHGIIASTSMLLEAIPASASGNDGSSCRDNAEIIRDCGEHMLALINNILDIERIESKRLQLECLPFKPAQELESLLKVFAAQAEQKRIQLRKAVDVRYPVRIGDPLRMKQILFNLVSNAIKFTSEGGTVTVRIIDESEDLRIEVEDTGIGIAEEHLCQLFKVHSRLGHVMNERLLELLTRRVRVRVAGFLAGGLVHHAALRRLRPRASHQPAAVRVDGRQHTLHVGLWAGLQVLVYGHAAHPLAGDGELPPSL
jgi:signal transduction histidine kinase